MKKRQTQLLGIVNCTPDSYFEASRFNDPQQAIEQALRLFDEGANIVDIGGESTRPNNSSIVSKNEEINRVIPVIRGIRKHTSLPLSIDTYKPEVAKVALEEGANLINDITGFTNPEMRRIAASSKAQCIVMHMKGKPHTIPKPVYPEGVIQEVLTFFTKQIELLKRDGVEMSKIILDPGIGGGCFGKSPEQVLKILKNLDPFKKLGFPLLLGISRKSFLQNILKKEASEVLSTTLALNTMIALGGAEYLRVHDIAEHRAILTLLEHMETVK